MRYFLLIFALAVVAVVAVAGWRGAKSRRPPIEIFADMSRQPKLRPQTHNNFFPDGLSSRVPVAGVVPQAVPVRVGDKLVFPFEDSPVNTGRVAGATNFVDVNPFPVTAAFLERGRQRFNIHCAACHTQLGDGNSVAKRIVAMPVVANLHDRRIVELPDGELFNTISYGKNLMQGYAPNVAVPDRWAVIAYLRALQLSRLGTLEDVPEPARANLKERP